MRLIVFFADLAIIALVVIVIWWVYQAGKEAARQKKGDNNGPIKPSNGSSWDSDATPHQERTHRRAR